MDLSPASDERQAGEPDAPAETPDYADRGKTDKPVISGAG
jgi:hypothetical protein